ncbi:hypothetical protein SAMN04488040_2259 [Sulfitobacter marinus]|uniref:Uncharacterized protein n=1 Tax=Sulfitobacter marinus TaxID=394264 RepID=A0A1I6THA5_9RHOB|nr:hypothetical protein [Sulfitobacter marinus]SFS88508.1 hypothetical protein SAMN04488040_2259 [Sulfitobacter marinus]
MTTWTFKGSLAAIGFMTLTACEAGQGPFNLDLAGNSAAPVTRAMMASGAVLVAPPGFCIDQASMTPDFMVMMRCDLLGMRDAAGSAPRGLITISLASSGTATLPSAQQIAAASGLTNLSAIQTAEGIVTFRARGKIPVGGLSPTHWRGAARIGSQLAGIAVYGPENGLITTSVGRDLVITLVQQSTKATPEPATSVPLKN